MKYPFDFVLLYFLKLLLVEIWTFNKLLHCTFLLLHVSRLIFWIDVSWDCFLSKFFYFLWFVLLGEDSFMILISWVVWLILKTSCIYLFRWFDKFGGICYFFEGLALFWRIFSIICLIVYHVCPELFVGWGLTVILWLYVVGEMMRIFGPGKLFWR